MSGNVNLIQTVISTLNRLSGVLQEPPEIVGQPSPRDASEDGDYNKLSKLPDKVMFENDIFNHIQQHSGRFKRKNLPGILESLHERALSTRVTAGDRSYIASRFFPNRPNHRETIHFGNDRPLCGTFERDGDIFVSATTDGFIRVFDTRTDQSKLLMTIGSHDEVDFLYDCAVSPDGRHVAYSMSTGKIFLQSIERDNMPAHATQDEGAPFPRLRTPCLRFFPVRDEIVAGGCDSQLYFFDLHTLKRTLELPVEDCISTLAVADTNSQIFYSGGKDGVVKVWDRRALHEHNAQPVGMFVGHRNSLVFIDSKNDARYLISNSTDQTIKLWDIRRLADSKDLQNFREYCVFGSRLFKPGERQQNERPGQYPGDVSIMTYRGFQLCQTEIRCRFSPPATTGQRFIYTGCQRGRVRVFDILSGKLLVSLGDLGRFTCIRDVSWHPYLPIIKMTSLDNTLREYYYSDEPLRDHYATRSFSRPRSRVARAIFND